MLSLSVCEMTYKKHKIFYHKNREMIALAVHVIVALFSLYLLYVTACISLSLNNLNSVYKN